MPVAVITGASRGLGRALATELVHPGLEPGRWTPGTSRPSPLRSRTFRVARTGPYPATSPTPTTDGPSRPPPAELGGADLLVNNASTLGASPLPSFADLDPTTYADVLAVNVVAPMALVRELLPRLRERGGRVLDISSDAAVEPYETWGGYGSSKAALDHATRILAAEEPTLRVYAVDPGDMRTQMHQDAFPGEDISDRPEPESVGPRPAAPGRPATCRAGGTAPPTSRGDGMNSIERSLADGSDAAATGRRGDTSRRRPAGWPATRSGWPW